MRLLITLVLLAAPLSAWADDDHRRIFEKAVEAIDFNFERSWAYTETQITSEFVRVGRYDPRKELGDRWQLLTIDGREPTAEEIEDYRRDQAHDHSDDNDERVDRMVEAETLQLVEETDDYWLLGFTPSEQEIMESVDATLRINKSTGHLEYVDLRNHEAIRPAFGVKISKLITHLTFGPAVEDGPIVPLGAQVEVKGRAFLVASFDEQEILSNSDFEYVGDAP